MFYQAHQESEFPENSLERKRWNTGLKFKEYGDYLLKERGFSMDTLLDMKVGLGEEMFKDDLDNYKLVPSVYFPMKKFDKRIKNNELVPSKVKIKGVKEFKGFI